jgi:hypothetical protein
MCSVRAQPKFFDQGCVGDAKANRWRVRALGFALPEEAMHEKPGECLLHAAKSMV